MDTVRLLLEHGAGVNAFLETDGTPLRLASQDVFLNVLRVLLGYGAADVEMMVQPHSGWPHPKDMAKSHNCY